MIARLLSLAVIAYLWVTLVFKIGTVSECQPLTASDVLVGALMMCGLWYLG